MYGRRYRSSLYRRRLSAIYPRRKLAVKVKRRYSRTGRIRSSVIKGYGAYHRRRAGRSYVTGRGSYKINNNSLLMGSDPPVIKNKAMDGKIYISHREYLGPIYAGGSTGPNGTLFNIQTFPLNPANQNTHPWLATVGPANGYQLWAPRGLIFEYKTLSTNSVVNTSSPTIGRVVMCTLLDASLPAPTNSLQMLETQYSCDASPDKSMIHPVECARSRVVLPEMYIANASLPSNVAPQFIYLGNFYIATENCPAAYANTLLGELWLSYEYALSSSYLPPAGELSTEQSGDKFALVNPTSSVLFGSNQVQKSGNPIGGTMVNNIYTFPLSVDSGNYLVGYHISGTGGVTGGYVGLTPSTGTTLNQYWSTVGGFDGTTNAYMPFSTSASMPYPTNTLGTLWYISITSTAQLPVTLTLAATGSIPTAGVGQQTYADFFVQTSALFAG